jgi:uncharacterized protein (TIRG00374 family)
MRRSIQLALGAAISLVCLVLAVRGLELGEVARALAQADYPWLVPALALYFAGVWVRAVRWQHLLWPIKRVRATRLFPVVVIGYMANDVLPFRLGEVARCFVLNRREGIAQSAALGTVLLERVMDGLTMLAFMGVALPLLPFSAALYTLMAGAGALFAGATVALAVLATRPALAARLVGSAVKPLPPALGQRAQRLATSFLAGLAALGGATATARVFALSCAAWLLEAGMYYSLMFAFPLTPSAALAVLTTAVANLGTLIPSSPGYIGVFDFLGRSVLAQFGVPEETALAYVLVVHAALVVPVTLLGFYFAWREGLALGRLAAGAASKAAAAKTAPAPSG